MPPPQPLGRSLIPLPGESQPGFLLRLSCRLNLAPAQIAQVTGLMASGRGARSPHAVLLAGIPETARRTFARATRLTDGQVAGLGLATWEERYPLPAWLPGKRPTLPTDRWSLFAPATRYCPECLAGDGSAVQTAFGGPWLKAWHLPAKAGRSNWARWVTVSAISCSEGLQAAYDPLLRRFTSPFGQPRGRSKAVRAARWGPENIPALIPEDWYERHFTPLADVSPILARRTAALRLVQMVARGSLAEAAHFLGISSGDGSRPRQGGRV